MIVLKITVFVFVCYLIAKAMNVNLNHELNNLKEENALLRKQLNQQKVEYQEKINRMNDVFNLFKGDNN
jgi:hypothetical protein